ncbi:MAG: AraC family transcriptional regulator, partial [Nannocystaceae bacterium]|nr:AraC family transcriptional regulator [Nannocystaceae bacterium]
MTDLDIDVCNIRPAFEASLAQGATESELEDRFGWSRRLLEHDGATVSGKSTYAHMEWMASRPGFAAFVLDTVSRHTPTSLGMVGLACKTAASLGEAMVRHGRYQALTNRTARYDAAVEGDTLLVEETRFGLATLGSQLVSDYTVLVAVQLFRSLLGPAVPMLRLHFRRESIPDAQRTAWEDFAGAPIVAGQGKAALVCSAELVSQPLPTHDVELSAFFGQLLERAAPTADDATCGARVLATIERRLADGTPTAESVAVSYTHLTLPTTSRV